MRQLLLLVLSLLFSTQIFAFGATTNTVNNIATWGSTASSDGSSDSTENSSKRDKIIEQAQNDAAAFVGSQGKVRGVYLEVALQHLRQNYPVSDATSDLKLAEAIMAY